MSVTPTATGTTGIAGSTAFAVPAGATFLQDVVFAVMSLRIKQQHAEVTQLIRGQESQQAIQAAIRDRITELGEAANGDRDLSDSKWGPGKVDFEVDAGGNVTPVQADPEKQYIGNGQWKRVDPRFAARAYSPENVRRTADGATEVRTYDQPTKAEIDTEIARLRDDLETLGSESELTMTRIGMFMNALGTSQTALSQMLKTIDETGDLMARNLGP